MSKVYNKKENIEREMLFEMIYDMNLSQLEKMTSYAAKLLNDKRYKKEKLIANEEI